MKHLLLLLCIFGLSACSTKNIKNNFSFKEGGNTGVVIVSVTQTQPHVISHLNYKGPKSGQLKSKKGKSAMGGFLLGMAYNPKNASHFQDTTGTLAVIELPEGEYSFNSWSIYVDPNSGIYSDKDKFTPLKFSVEKGQYRYIGNADFEIGMGENMLGISGPAAARLKVKNEYNRDMAVLKELYPAFQNRETIKSLAQK